MGKIFFGRWHSRKNKFLLNNTPRFFILLLLLTCCILMFSVPATAARKPKVDKTKPVPVETSTPPSESQPTQQSASNVHPVTQAAVNAGVLACTSRINQVITYLTANSQSGVYLFFPKSQPDQSIFSASIEVQTQNATPIYASASFAPLTSGQAGAVYDSVEYMSQSCDYIEKNIFKDLKRTGILKKDIIMLDGGAVKVFLMPAGTGCIVIKKEVVQ